MADRATLGRSLVAGGGMGLVAGVGLGVLGRIAMRVIAVRAGLPVGGSVGGTLEVLATGALIGGLVGLIYGPLRWRLPSLLWARGLIVGGVLAAVFAVYQPPAARSALRGVGHGGLSLPLFAGCFVAFGWLLEWLLRRLDPPS